MIFNDRYSKRNLARDFLFQGEEGLTEIQKKLTSGDLAKAKFLTLIDLKNADLSFIGSLRHLRHLTILCPSRTDIDISKLSKLTRLDLGRAIQKRIQGIERLVGLERISLRSPDPKDLARLGGSGNFLAVHGCPPVWPEILNTVKLRKIKIYPMRKEQLDVSQMANLKNLEDLSINSISKGVVNAARLESLRNLRILHLWDVPSLDSKDWIFGLPNLELVAIWGAHNFTKEELSGLGRRGIFDGEDPDTVLRKNLKGLQM